MVLGTVIGTVFPIQKASAEDQRPPHLRIRLKVTNKYAWNVFTANVNKTYRRCISYHPTVLGPRVRTPDCTNGALPRVALDPCEKQNLASAIDGRRDSNVELSRPSPMCLYQINDMFYVYSSNTMFYPVWHSRCSHYSHAPIEHVNRYTNRFGFVFRITNR